MKNEDLDFLRLCDLYSPLLTKTQREITDLYFNYDLSLAEIAEEKGVSRQSVSDCLTKCRRQLEEYDKKLGFTNAIDELSREYSAYMTMVCRWISAMKEKGGMDDELSALEKSLEGVHQEFGVEKTDVQDGSVFGKVISREE